MSLSHSQGGDSSSSSIPSTFSPLHRLLAHFHRQWDSAHARTNTISKSLETIDAEIKRTEKASKQTLRTWDTFVEEVMNISQVLKGVDALQRMIETIHTDIEYVESCIWPLEQMRMERGFSQRESSIRAEVQQHRMHVQKDTEAFRVSSERQVEDTLHRVHAEKAKIVHDIESLEHERRMQREQEERKRIDDAEEEKRTSLAAAIEERKRRVAAKRTGGIGPQTTLHSENDQLPISSLSLSSTSSDHIFGSDYVVESSSVDGVPECTENNGNVLSTPDSLPPVEPVQNNDKLFVDETPISYSIESTSLANNVDSAEVVSSSDADEQISSSVPTI